MANKQNRKFTVTKGVVGPFPLGHSFDEDEFRRVTKIPKHAIDNGDVDTETYHGDLIGRLLTLGVIAHTPDATPRPAPLGPESMPTVPQINHGIKASGEAVIADRESLAAGSPPLATPEQARAAKAPK